MTMIMQWVFYCIALSIALALGARSLEAAARAGRLSTRWCWAVALSASVLLPFVSYMRPIHVPAVERPVSYLDIPAPSFTPLSPPPASASPRGTPVETGVFLWATSSLLALLIIGISYVRLRLARRSWTQAEVAGIPVWLSEDTGPAALGVLKCGIVLPRWVLSFEERSLSLMLLHEREHLHAGDPRLMLLSVLLVAAMPWNPVAWIMVRRLRLAIEVDCDQRVLSRKPDFLAYGAVLLEVGRQRSSPTFALSTFAEPHSQLEERIRRIAERSNETRWLRAAAMLVLALPLSGAAYTMHAPIHARVVVDGPVASTGTTSAADTIAPSMLNSGQVFRRLVAGYPPALRSAGIEGSVLLNLHILRNGVLDIIQVARKSGHPELDHAANEVIREAKFNPATTQGRNVQSWVKVELTFAIDQEKVAITTMTNGAAHRFPPASSKIAGNAIRKPAQGKPAMSKARQDSLQRGLETIRLAREAELGRQLREVDSSHASDLESAPFITPMTVRPRLVNQPEVEAAIKEYYPRNLRDVGIGGKTIIWFFIDAAGRSKTQRLSTSSGNDEIDRAALNVAKTLRFTPAENQGKKVPVWVQIPIVFSSSASLVAEQGGVRAVEMEAIQNSRMPASKSTSTGMTVRPKLLNVDEVAIAISNAYPQALRDEGIGGKVLMWFYIDDTGRVVKMQVNTSSGYDALDKAAMKIGPVLRFQPQEKDGKAVPVWVQIPIIFTTS